MQIFKVLFLIETKDLDLVGCVNNNINIFELNLNQKK